jgi:transposase
MKRVPKGKYTKEFREEAVKLVTEEGLSFPDASLRLSLPLSTIRNWVLASKAGKLEGLGKYQRPLTEIEMELAKVKRELVKIKMERDILKKAAAYFAKESLPGTRR